MTRDVPSDHDTFAGEIPWHPRFAAVALTEHGYREHVRSGAGNLEVEVLAHDYAWESYHSEMNQAGNARVPSPPFSSHFELRGAPQTFDQFLADGTRATITLSGVDGLDADILLVFATYALFQVTKRLAAINREMNAAQVMSQFIQTINASN